MLGFSFSMDALTCQCRSVVKESTVTFLNSNKVSNNFRPANSIFVEFLP